MFSTLRAALLAASLLAAGAAQAADLKWVTYEGKGINVPVTSFDAGMGNLQTVVLTTNYWTYADFSYYSYSDLPMPEITMASGTFGDSFVGRAAAWGGGLQDSGYTNIVSMLVTGSSEKTFTGDVSAFLNANAITLSTYLENASFKDQNGNVRYTVDAGRPGSFNSGASFTVKYGYEATALPSSADPVAAVPEPATWAMLLVGFAMVGASARYRRRSTQLVLN